MLARFRIQNSQLPLSQRRNWLFGLIVGLLGSTYFSAISSYEIKYSITVRKISSSGTLTTCTMMRYLERAEERMVFILLLSKLFHSCCHTQTAELKSPIDVLGPGLSNSSINNAKAPGEKTR